MTKYLKTKEGSIEDVAKQMQNKVMENDYQDKFKKRKIDTSNIIKTNKNLF